MITYCFIKHIKTIAFIFCFLMTHVAYAQKIIVTLVDGYAARLLEGRDFEEENDIGTKELVSSKAMALQPVWLIYMVSAQQPLRSLMLLWTMEMSG